jgi:hypothetical protein
MRRLLGKLKAKVDQPPRQPDRPRVNQDQDLARKEAREIESYGKKKLWVKRKNFWW